MILSCAFGTTEICFVAVAVAAATILWAQAQVTVNEFSSPVDTHKTTGHPQDLT